MKKIRNILVFAAVLLSISAVGASAQNDEFRGQNNRNIERQIFKKILAQPNYGVFDHITFSFDNGTVVLGGKVNSLGTRNGAASAVKRIAGVKEVVNNIDQLPASPFDSRIRRSALRTFTSRGPSRYFSEVNPEVRIIVENGRMTLEGYVSNKGDRNLLNVLANSIPGVFKVTNNLVIGKERFS